jgi:hypothetical protein
MIRKKEVKMASITAQVVDDWTSPDYEGRVVFVVIESDHPRFFVGSHLDSYAVEKALADGWTVTIKPHEINKLTCTHPNGFDRISTMLTKWDKKYRLYWCPICHAERGIGMDDEPNIVDHYPTNHPWPYIEQP